MKNETTIWTIKDGVAVSTAATKGKLGYTHERHEAFGKRAWSSFVQAAESKVDAIEREELAVRMELGRLRELHATLVIALYDARLEDGAAPAAVTPEVPEQEVPEQEAWSADPVDMDAVVETTETGELLRESDFVCDAKPKRAPRARKSRK